MPGLKWVGSGLICGLCCVYVYIQANEMPYVRTTHDTEDLWCTHSYFYHVILSAHRALLIFNSLTCSATFLGAYRLVPPFLPPSGCPVIPACAQHSRQKEGCRRCEEVARSAEADETVPSAAIEAEGRSALSAPEARAFLGLPVPPVKFFTRARVRTPTVGRALSIILRDPAIAKT